MPPRTNMADAEALNDYRRNEDFARDLGAEDESIRDTILDIYDGRPVIGAGLLVVDGAAADTFLVTAGRARDCNGRHIVVPVNVDNIPCANNTGAYNYIAIRHVWTYANPDAACKSGLAYNRQRSDGYEIQVTSIYYPAAHSEAAGWVRIARAAKVAGVWWYDYENYGGMYPRSGSVLEGASFGTSRTGTAQEYTCDFSYLGAPPGATLMNRHTVAAVDFWRVPYDFRVLRVEVDARLADPAANTQINLFQNGVAHAAWPAGTLILTALATNAVWYNPEGMTVAARVEYYKDDLIQVQLFPLGAGPTDITVVISGYCIGTI